MSSWNSYKRYSISSPDAATRSSPSTSTTSELPPDEGGAQAAVAPVPSASRRRKKRYTRSRSGCLTCRKRKVKCDEAKPVCTKCHDLDKECVWAPPANTSGTTSHPQSRSHWHASSSSGSSRSRSPSPPTRCEKRYKSALTHVTYVPDLPVMGSTVEWFVNRDLARPRFFDGWDVLERRLREDQSGSFLGGEVSPSDGVKT